MALEAGTRLGHYEVVSSLGAGGMGEVYRAKDTKLGREVAIKLLLEEVSADPERMARFEREARVLASLNHPNIATLHGFERDGDTNFLVMELVEGETLADRIKRGAIPVDEALPLFLQIAEGLEAAHEKGVIHRDLKPANIKLGGDGSGVKILDFGLAKAMAQAGGRESSPSESPTITTAGHDRTLEGRILGTAAYMSPEQAQGRAADHRADIWAFGVCLFEALSGKDLFRGDSPSMVMASVLKDEPLWSDLPDDLPPGLSKLLRRCLVKRRRDRLQAIGDARLELADPLLVREPRDEPRSRPVLTWAVVALLVGVALGSLLLSWLRPQPPEPTDGIRWVASGNGAPAPVVALGGIDVAITPDGKRLIYVVDQEKGQALFVRRVDRLEGAVLSGTQSAGIVQSPFVSPDGRWVGFWDHSEQALKKVSIEGGPAVTLSREKNAGFLMGASWGADGTIVTDFGHYENLLRVSAAGGDLENLTVVDQDAGEVRHGNPQFLPGTSQILFSVRTKDGNAISALSLGTGERRTILERGGDRVLFSSSGHLLFVEDNILLAVAFDADRLEVESAPMPVLEGLVTKSGGDADLALSQAGRMVFISGNRRGGERRRLAWVDRDGKSDLLGGPVSEYWHVRIAPDGGRAAVEQGDEEGYGDLWIWDLSRETADRFTYDPADDGLPVWAPDGETIFFGSKRDGDVNNVYSKAVSGTSAAVRLTESPYNQIPISVSPDGKWLVYQEAAISQDLYLLPIEGGNPEALLTSKFDERAGIVSNDGKWLVYHSNEAGDYQVFVRPFPNVADGRFRISADGGSCCAVWSRDGSEIFYRHLDRGELFVTPLDTSAGFRAGTPRRLFEWDAWGFGYSTAYDVSADGTRFLASLPVLAEEGGPTYRVVVFENWFEELKRLVPTD